MSLFTTTVTVVRRGERIGRDEHQRPVYAPGERSVAPAWFEQSTQDEDLESGEQYSSSYRVFLPLSVSLTGADAVELPGLDGEFQLIGQPSMQPGGFIVEGYQVLTVRKDTG